MAYYFTEEVIFKTDLEPKEEKTKFWILEDAYEKLEERQIFNNDKFTSVGDVKKIIYKITDNNGEVIERVEMDKAIKYSAYGILISVFADDWEGSNIIDLEAFEIKDDSYILKNDQILNFTSKVSFAKEASVKEFLEYYDFPIEAINSKNKRIIITLFKTYLEDADENGELGEIVNNNMQIISSYYFKRK